MSKIEQDFVRVSTIVNAWSAYDSIPPHILHNAADRGTRTHSVISGIYSGIPPLDIDKDIKPYVQAFESFKASNPLTPLLIEKRFYSKLYMLTGAVDLIARDRKGKTVLIDFKTSSKYYPSWPLQLAGYKMVAACNDVFPDYYMNVKLNKDGTFETFLFDKIDEYDNMFFQLLKLYEYLHIKT